MSYKIQETYVNRTRGYQFHESTVNETHIESLGELFKKCQKEFGRCEGKIFIEDISHSEPRQVGWIFVKDCLYDDGRASVKTDWYTREVWVTVFADDGDETFQK